MVRTQIQLTAQQARFLRAQARERGVSLAEIIRQYVERGMSEQPPDRAALYERAARLVGRFPDRDRKRDVARRHDHYLDDAFR